MTDTRPPVYNPPTHLQSPLTDGYGTAENFNNHSPYQTDCRDRVYPWSDRRVLVLHHQFAKGTSTTTTMTATTRITTNCILPREIRSDPLLKSESVMEDPTGVVTKLFTSTTTRSESDERLYLKETPASYGSNLKQGRLHSILRMNSSGRSTNTRGIKKSASVEFSLHEEDIIPSSEHSRRFSNGSSSGRDLPRRLTFEEKEELYRIRPDLEIGPVPYFNEQMEELKRRNQRRILFSIFGGVICLIMLLVFYSMMTES